MRGHVDPQASMFSYFSPESRVPVKHPLVGRAGVEPATNWLKGRPVKRNRLQFDLAQGLQEIERRVLPPFCYQLMRSWGDSP